MLNTPRTLGVGLLAAALVGCGGAQKTVIVEKKVAVPAASATEVLDPLQLKQFATPLPIIPDAVPDRTSRPGQDAYTVIAEQTTGYDFGLRKRDGSEFVDPVTGAPLRTTVWGYTINGLKAGYLGASVQARSTLAGETGRPVSMKYVNDLRGPGGALLTRHLFTVDKTMDGSNAGESELRIVTHLHGGHVPPEFDGHPLAWVSNDPAAKTGLPADPVTGRPARPDGNTVTYTYPNTQAAGQIWFHDHALGITRINVYAGLAANYFVRDAQEDALNLPSGAYEIPLVIQDKSFHKDGSLHYSAVPLLDATGEQAVVDGQPVFTSYPEFFGNTIVVNGKVWPYLDVEPRKYRFRLLNGSDSRFYRLWLEAAGGGAIPASAVQLIGNEGGLLPAAVPVGRNDDTGLLLAPAERADLIVDFSKFAAGTVLTVRNDAATPYPGGDPVAANTTGRILQFRITKALTGADTSALPAAPKAPVRPAGWDTPVRTAIFDLQETDEYDRFTYNPETGTALPRLMLKVNGRAFEDPLHPQEQHDLDAIEDWVLINSTADMHPMHIHLVHFEVLEKGTLAADDYAPATVLAMPDVLGAGLQPDVDDLGQTVDHGSNSAYTVRADEAGWKETVRVPPASADGLRVGYVRVRAKFDIAGTYMWHCHILAHEEHEMMRPFAVVAPGSVTNHP